LRPFKKFAGGNFQVNSSVRSEYIIGTHSLKIPRQGSDKSVKTRSQFFPRVFGHDVRFDNFRSQSQNLALAFGVITADRMSAVNSKSLCGVHEFVVNAFVDLIVQIPSVHGPPLNFCRSLYVRE
jgi:hypothetical protein